MKRRLGYHIISILLLITMVLILSSCENEPEEQESKENQPLQEINEEVVKIMDEDDPIMKVTVEQQSLPGRHIKVNQVGYPALSKKVAIISNVTSATKFDLLRLDTGEVVLSGDLTTASEDADSRDVVQIADFSKAMMTGTYIVSVPEAGTSYPFQIGDGIYRSVFMNTVRTFTLQRSLTHIDDPLTGYRFAAGHSQDKAAVIHFTDHLSHKGDLIDVSGGWYDAGDYGKYVAPGAASAAFLLLAYDFNPDRFKVGQLLFPPGVSEQEQSAGIPDILSEVKFELDWLIKMQREDGMVYHKVAGLGWPDLSTPPAGDLSQRYVFGKSTYDTAIFAGTLALAARIYEPFDKTYANKLLDRAKRAFDYLEQNPEFEYYTHPEQDLGSGAYHKSTDHEDRFWAAAELLRTTGDLHYEHYLQDKFSHLFSETPGVIGFEHPLLFGQWAYYNSSAGNEANKQELKNAVVKQADNLIIQINGNGYYNSLSSNEYVWGSNRIVSSKGVHLLIANQMENKEEYEVAALDQIHYILGRNALGHSYVTKTGTVFTSQPHHRIVNSTMVLIPGLMVGGPNSQGGDSAIDRLKAELPPAKAYVDDLVSYSTNEYALDYNAPLCFLLAYFAEE